MRDQRPRQISRAQEGAPPPELSGQALGVLYQRYWTEICAYLRKTFGKGPPDPEDMAQQAFMSFAGLADADAVGNARAYLYRTAHNLTVDQIRRLGAHHRAIVALFPQTERHSDEFTPERVLEARERLRVLADAIRATPEPRRSSFIQCRLHGLSAAEIARRTGYSESNIKKHIMLVMRDLEAALALAERTRVRQGGGS